MGCGKLEQNPLPFARLLLADAQSEAWEFRRLSWQAPVKTHRYQNLKGMSGGGHGGGGGRGWGLPSRPTLPPPADTNPLGFDEYLYCLVNGKFALCPGKLKTIPDSHEHRSWIRHLSQTEVGSVEKDRSSSEAGEGTPWSFLSVVPSCKQSERHMAPSTDSGTRALRQTGL